MTDTPMIERVAAAVEPLIILELGGQQSARLASPQAVARAAIEAHDSALTARLRARDAEITRLKREVIDLIAETLKMAHAATMHSAGKDKSK